MGHTQLRIEGLGDWNDGQIVDLAMIAHEEMAGRHRHFDWEQHTDVPRKDWRIAPTVTTALIAGDIAYISTSMKGGSYMCLEPEAPNKHIDLDPRYPCAVLTETALKDLQLERKEGWGHRTGASCGEVWAAQGQHGSANTTSPCIRLDDTKIVSVRTRDRQTIIVGLCGHKGPNVKYKGEWGCAQFTKATGIYLVSQDTKRSTINIDLNKVVSASLPYFREKALPPFVPGDEETTTA